MNSQEIEMLAETEFYANQLISLKYCFGLKAKLGCVVFTDGKPRTVYCETMQQLYDIGWIQSPELLVIDQYIHNLEVHPGNLPENQRDRITSLEN